MHWEWAISFKEFNLYLLIHGSYYLYFEVCYKDKKKDIENNLHTVYKKESKLLPVNACN